MKALSLLGFAQAAGHLISGYNGCLTTLRRGQCYLVVLATDASPATKEKFIGAARGTPVIIMSTKDDLGKAVGKPSRAVLCVREPQMAEAIARAVNTTAMEAEGANGRVT
ncbi:MAG: 50S ribosomal protein L7ae [Firmicutes bacterium]|nr:50S ribosomal protein L7ae [Bacillota bacterium]